MQLNVIYLARICNVLCHLPQIHDRKCISAAFRWHRKHIVHWCDNRARLHINLIRKIQQYIMHNISNRYFLTIVISLFFRLMNFHKYILTFLTYLFPSDLRRYCIDLSLHTDTQIYFLNPGEIQSVEPARIFYPKHN